MSRDLQKLSSFQPSHICLFVPALNEGGAERVMVRLANAFHQRGHQVDLVAATLQGPFIKELVEGVNIVDLGCNRTITSIIPLARYLRRSRPDAMLSTLTHANIVACIAAKLAMVSTRVVVREAGLPTLEKKQQGNTHPKGFMRIARWVFPWAHSIVGVSNGVIKELKGILQLENKVDHSVIYNPVISDQLYRLSEQPIAYKSDSSVHADVRSDIFSKPVVLGIGRLSVEKDFSTLIDAFAAVRHKLDCHLLVLGSGELEHQLKQQCKELGISDFVFMPGFVENPYPYIKQCSVYVLSSVSEGLPNALIEALALHVPVVSTDIVNGPSEILEQGKWGALVPVGDAQAMAEGIEQCLKSSGSSIPKSDPWWQRFSEDAVVDTYLRTLLQNER